MHIAIQLVIIKHRYLLHRNNMKLIHLVIKCRVLINILFNLLILNNMRQMNYHYRRNRSIMLIFSRFKLPKIILMDLLTYKK